MNVEALLTPAFFQDLGVLSSLMFAIIWAGFELLKWSLERSTEPRFRRLPASVFNLMYARLVKKNETLLVTLTAAHISPEELFEAFQPERMTAHNVEALSDYIPGLVDELMSQQNPTLWNNLPALIRNQFYQKTHQLLPPLMDDFIDRLGAAFKTLCNYETLIQKQLKAYPELLTHITIGSLTFFWQSLRNRALLFAALLALFVCALTHANLMPMPSSWTHTSLAALALTLVSVTLAYVSCRPTRPHRSKSFNPAHLFKMPGVIWLQQQQHFNLMLAAQLPTRVFYLPQVMQHIFNHPAQQDIIRRLVDQSLRPLTETGSLRLLTQTLLGPRALVELKLKAVDVALSVSDIPFNNSTYVQKQTQNISQFLSVKLGQIPPHTYFNLIRPLTQEVYIWLIPACLSTGLGLSVLVGFLASF